VVDKLTYAGNLLNLEHPLKDPRVTFVQADIADHGTMMRLFRDVRPDAVLNLAAETHVDRSIDGPRPFIDTNIRFLHVSTDEVYGTLGPIGLFSEETAFAPNSPYAASKAAADHLVRAYYHTYGLPALMTNCSNNYGPFQYPEKLVPLMILTALGGQPLPIYGDGGNVRDWLYVDDHCAGILLVLKNGRTGERYNIGGGNERTNVEIVDRICDALDELRPAASNPALRARSSYRELKTYVADRPGHDRRYAIDATKIRRELDWSPRHRFEDRLASTVRWYLDHREWCEAVQAGRYERQRLGLVQ
jgi:dTDP-glucose 4,6-dehydratase